MPVIFHKHAGRWEAMPLSGSQRRLFLAPVACEQADAETDLPAGAGLLMRAKGDGHDDRWVLLLQPGERAVHNGQPVAAGLRVLAHRDSLAQDGRGAVFFSTEQAARIAPFDGPQKVTCPRCRDAITPGQPAVKCPACGVFHHETGERNCWTYATTCALCTQPTALGAGLQWTPEAL